MVTFDDIRRALSPIKAAIQRVIARAVIESIKNTGSTQLIKAMIYADELAEDIEHVEEYGFTSYAKPGAEALLAAPGGSHDRAVAVTVADRRYRPVDLNEGDVELYTCNNTTGTTKHRVWLRDNASTGQLEIIVEGDMTILGGHDSTLVYPAPGAPQAILLADAMKLFYDAHVHPTGVGPSGAPAVPMVITTGGQASTKVKAV